jgi:protein gp37
MANGSRIEWTEATWNPTTGCTKVSSGCKNCYAATLSKRLKAMGLEKYRNEFQFTQHPSELDIPLRWKKPKKIFVNSMSDLFHEEATMEFIGRCFNTMMQANWHTYQVLTKRPTKMAEFSNLFYKYFGQEIPSHIWMGTSVENEDNVWRINELRKVKCNIRFISFEPLIGSVGELDLNGIDWAIIGGESGFGFRLVKKEWIMEIIKQCRRQGVKIFFKQWGGIRPKSGGRIINNRTYDEYPTIKKAVPLYA